MSHIEVLEFELKALKSVLESQQKILNIYTRSFLDELKAGRETGIQIRASQSVVDEYSTQHIPRTERHIAALEYALSCLTNS